jgi:hypothetical protein
LKFTAEQLAGAPVQVGKAPWYPAKVKSKYRPLGVAVNPLPCTTTEEAGNDELVKTIPGGPAAPSDQATTLELVNTHWSQSVTMYPPPIYSPMAEDGDTS